MRFLFVGPGLCLQLPSDSTSRWTPLLFSSRFPSSGLVEDFHPESSGRHHACQNSAVALRIMPGAHRVRDGL
jgi:hypothetical protein